MRWLKNLLVRNPAPSAPILMRVQDAEGRRPGALDVEARWSPSGGQTHHRVRTAEGLCVIPWRRGEGHVALSVSTDEGYAEVRVSRRGGATGVNELVLEPRAGGARVSRTK